MKCTILHESRGRMRVHVNAVRMTLHRADVLEAYLNHSEVIEHAKVYERTGDVLRSEEHTSELQSQDGSRMPSSA